MFRNSLALCALLTFGFACQEGGNAAGGTKKASYKVAVIPKGLTHEFWLSIHAGALQAKAELEKAGVTVAIDWQGPDKESDREQQIKIVQTEIVKGVDAIVLAPLDKTALVGPVLQAKREKIPVVVIDSGLDTEPENYVSFVATDNLEGGRKAGQRLVELIRARQKEDAGFEPKIVLLRYAPGHASTSKREAGFLAAIEEAGLSSAILSKNVYGGETRELAQQAAESLLTKFGDQVTAVFAPNESSAYGLLQAVKRKGLAGKVMFVGFDASPSLVAALKSREIDGLVLQDPVRMGYLGVTHAVQHLRGKPLASKHVDTGSRVATPENMTTPEIRKLLTPDLSILGK